MAGNNQFTMKLLPPRQAALACVVLLVAMSLAVWNLSPGLGWLATVAAITCFAAVIGQATTGRVTGILINERKLMSVSRFQVLLWTIVIFSSYFTAALLRVKLGAPYPLMVTIPEPLWWLIGISTASVVGSPMLSNYKKRREPDDERVYDKLNAAFQEDRKVVDEHREGVLYANAKIEDARFTDMFEGDELRDTQYIDIAKVQMFLFTLIVVVTYSANVIQMVGDLTILQPATLPPVEDGLIALMGISHAGYLTNKGMNHTSVQRQPG